ncbi:MAG TPA: hypothetical protein PKB02_05530 [Anaerohalosphaeraceae bacterium]|nr:hypothetical protein [Anaerohalosphaeraceae bacterium]
MRFMSRVLAELIVMPILLIQMGCQTVHLNSDRHTLFRRIDQNAQMSPAEKAFAKRYHTYVMRNLLSCPEPNAKKILMESSFDMMNQQSGRWGLPENSNFSYEERLYLKNVSAMVDKWTAYSHVDAENLSEEERLFLNAVHLKYGNEPVKVKANTGYLTRNQRLLLEQTEVLSGSSYFGDQELVYLYRKGGASVLPIDNVTNTILPPQSSRVISDITYCGDGKFLLVIPEMDYPRMGGSSWLYRSVLCDETGKILRVSELNPIRLPFLPQQCGRIISRDSAFPQTWIWMSNRESHVFNLFDKTGSWIDDRLYIGTVSQSGFDSTLLLSTKGQKRKIDNWWYFEKEGRKLLFTITCDYSSSLHHLQYYEYDGNALNYIQEYPLDDEHYVGREYAFGMDKDSFYLWIINTPRLSLSQDLVDKGLNDQLRMATVPLNGLLEWKFTYHGGYLSSLYVNPACASAVRLSEGKDAISEKNEELFAFSETTVNHCRLTKNGKFCRGIAYVEKLDAWAAVTWQGDAKGQCVTFFDRKLEVLDKIEIPALNKAGYLHDFHMIYADDKLYLIVLVGDKKDSVFLQEIDYSHLFPATSVIASQQ